MEFCSFFFNFSFILNRATLRRGFAFSSSIKNPPLLKSRNIQSQNSFNASNAPQPAIGGSSASQTNTGTSQHQFAPLSIGANASAISSQNVSPDSCTAKTFQQLQMKVNLPSHKPTEATNKSMDVINFESNTHHNNESDV